MNENDPMCMHACMHTHRYSYNFIDVLVDVVEVVGVCGYIYVLSYLCVQSFCAPSKDFMHL